MSLLIFLSEVPVQSEWPCRYANKHSCHYNRFSTHMGVAHHTATPYVLVIQGVQTVHPIPSKQQGIQVSNKLVTNNEA